MIKHKPNSAEDQQRSADPNQPASDEAPFGEQCGFFLLLLPFGPGQSGFKTAMRARNRLTGILFFEFKMTGAVAADALDEHIPFGVAGHIPGQSPLLVNVNPSHRRLIPYSGRVIPLLIIAAVLEAAAPPVSSAGKTNKPGTELSQSVPEVEFQKLTLEDDAAQAKLEKIRNESSGEPGKTLSEEQLKQRTDEVLLPLQKRYESYLQREPKHVGALLAYGNILNLRQDEAAAQVQWEKALALDPKNADAYNNLAGRYSETGPAAKAFGYYEKAIELKPTEPVYYHNFADTLCVLSKHAMKHYQVDEQQIYAKASLQYSNAARLEPRSFAFASDAGEVYYHLKPLPVESALQAWTNALNVAATAVERELVYIHLARVKMLAGRLSEARDQLNGVTHEQTATLKANLLRAIGEREKETGTNAPGGSSPAKP